MILILYYVTFVSLSIENRKLSLSELFIKRFKFKFVLFCSASIYEDENSQSTCEDEELSSILGDSSKMSGNGNEEKRVSLYFNF